jgi:HAE1 family hydrophobic/amphiphilic exporter-1/multidrug efflux pump
VVAFTGFDFLGGGFRNNAATIFVTQVPWHERKVSTPQVVGDFFMKTGHIKEGLALAFGPPAIFGLGTAGGFEFYIQNRGNGGSQRWRRRSASSSALHTRSAGSASCRRFGAHRCRSSTSTSTARRRRRSACRSRSSTARWPRRSAYYVNDFNKFGRTWQVLMSADRSHATVRTTSAGVDTPERGISRSPRSPRCATARVPIRSTALITCRR